MKFHVNRELLSNCAPLWAIFHSSCNSIFYTKSTDTSIYYYFFFNKLFSCSYSGLFTHCQCSLNNQTWFSVCPSNILSLWGEWIKDEYDILWPYVITTALLCHPVQQQLWEAVAWRKSRAKQQMELAAAASVWTRRENGATGRAPPKHLLHQGMINGSPAGLHHPKSKNHIKFIKHFLVREVQSTPFNCYYWLPVWG